ATADVRVRAERRPGALAGVPDDHRGRGERADPHPGEPHRPAAGGRQERWRDARRVLPRRALPQADRRGEGEDPRVPRGRQGPPHRLGRRGLGAAQQQGVPVEKVKPVKAEISYDLVMEDEMSFVEGTYRLPGGEWQVFIFIPWQGSNAVVWTRSEWDSGVTGRGGGVLEEVPLEEVGGVS